MDTNEQKKTTQQNSEEECKHPIPAPTYSPDEDWVKQHKKNFSEEPSFF